MNKLLSVVVTSFRNPSVLRLCLQSLLKHASHLDPEIIVSDSATEEETDMMMREEFPDISFVPFHENVGYGKLVNKGIQKAKGEHILIINADIITEKNSIDRLLAYLKEHEGVGLVGPKLLNFDGRVQPSCFRFYTPLIILCRRTFLRKFGFAKKQISRFLLKDKDLSKPLETDWLMGSAIMGKKSAISKVGQLDSRFFLYFEDVDWCRRFWENRLRVVYLPYARMFHYHGKGSANSNVLRSIAFNPLTRIHIMSAIKYFWKYFRKPDPHANFQVNTVH